MAWSFKKVTTFPLLFFDRAPDKPPKPSVHHSLSRFLTVPQKHDLSTGFYGFTPSTPVCLLEGLEMCWMHLRPSEHLKVNLERTCENTHVAAACKTHTSTCMMKAPPMKTLLHSNTTIRDTCHFWQYYIPFASQCSLVPDWLKSAHIWLLINHNKHV